MILREVIVGLSIDELRRLYIELNTIGRESNPKMLKTSDKMECLFKIQDDDYQWGEKYQNIKNGIQNEVFYRFVNQQM